MNTLASGYLYIHGVTWTCDARVAIYGPFYDKNQIILSTLSRSHSALSILTQLDEDKCLDEYICTSQSPVTSSTIKTISAIQTTPTTHMSSTPTIHLVACSFSKHYSRQTHRLLTDFCRIASGLTFHQTERTIPINQTTYTLRRKEKKRREITLILLHSLASKCMRPLVFSLTVHEED
jgi:hypothetical protein